MRPWPGLEDGLRYPGGARERGHRDRPAAAFVTHRGGGPSALGGVKLSRTGPSPIQRAPQPDTGSSSTSNVAGELHGDIASAPSQTRTRHQ